MSLTRTVVLALALGISVSVFGGLYAFQQIAPVQVADGPIESITWERSGGLIGIEEELVISADRLVEYTSDIFGDSDFEITEDDFSNLIGIVSSLGNERFLPHSSSENFFNYRVTIESTSPSITVEWVDDWASEEILSPEVEGLQGQIESIIARIWFLSGASHVADERAIMVAEEFIVQSSTFRFDSLPETLEVGEVVTLESIPPIYNIGLSFDSTHSGFGDRAGEALEQVITHHEATLVVVREHVISAIIDDQWDELNQEAHIVRTPPSGPLPQIILQQGTGANAIRHEGVQGSYCWGTNPGEPAVCVDFALPEDGEEFNSLQSIEVINGSEISIAIEGFEEPDTYHISIYSVSLGEYVFSGPTENVLTIDLQPGSFLLIVSASWTEGGDTSKFFKLLVAE